MEYITLGYILKPFGLKGEVRCKSLTSFGSIRFKKGTTVSLHNEKTDERVDVTIAKYRDSGDYYFLAFAEFPDINLVEKYKGFAIEMDKSLATVPDGFYRYDDLIGCKVIDYLDENRIIGNVIDRLFRGYVIDMFDFHWGVHHYPCFNVADVLICVSVGLLLLSSFRAPRKSPR